MTAQEDHESKRKECWYQAAAHVAGAETCKSTDAAISWANSILKEFDRKFPAPPITTTSTKQPKES